MRILFVALAALPPPARTEREARRGGCPRYKLFRQGLAGADVIKGRGGNDRLYGRGGNNHLYGGRGADRYSCGPGRDVVYADRSDVRHGRIAGDCEIVRGLPSPPPSRRPRRPARRRKPAART